MKGSRVNSTERQGWSSATLKGQTGVQPAGFTLEDCLLPYTDYSFPGYRILQEYFAYRDKFFFFDLCGLDKLQPTEEMEGFEAQVVFNRQFPEGRRLTAGNFRLHCTPIINLFSVDAEPLRVNYLDAEYRVIADVRHLDSIEVYSVDVVEGIVTGTEERRAYVPFYSFKHGLDASGRKQKHRYYHTSTRPHITRRDITPDLGLGLTQEVIFVELDTYISIVNTDVETEGPMEETLSLEVTCTNGRWPRELRLGEICYPTEAVPEFVTFKNLTRPTLPIYPPLQEQHFEWNLISHLALNYLSLSDADAFRGILELYEWSQSEANRRRIASIRSVNFFPKEIIYRGSVIRGSVVKLLLARENFADEGDLHLFGLVLNEFLGMYASINSFVQLQLECPSGERFEWPPKKGKNLLI
jgi:type VI secretion system protein ImpG